MKILHTSDWHLGRTLYGQQRYEEFGAFLSWLGDFIEKEGVDVLLIAGDVFDTTTPGVRAQELYYGFLSRLASGPCHHVVITGGNHDSPSFLNAPGPLLAALNVHVVGAVSGNPEEEVLLLEFPSGIGFAPEPPVRKERLLVCAVPFLRDRDVRISEAGESSEDKQARLVAGIRSHYALVCGLAEEKRKALMAESCFPRIPLLVMGHLFAAGGSIVEGDGVRDLYVGSLAHVPAAVFPDFADYVALGHLHGAQKVSGAEHIRYSGAPLAMGFGEAGRAKSLCLITFELSEEEAPRPGISLVPVPVFQELVRLEGDWETLLQGIASLAERDASAWLELIYTGEAVKGDLRESLERAVADTGLKLLCIKNRQIRAGICTPAEAGESLSDLGVEEVFDRCLAAHAVPEFQQEALRQLYKEVLLGLEVEQNAHARADAEPGLRGLGRD